MPADFNEKQNNIEINLADEQQQLTAERRKRKKRLAIVVGATVAASLVILLLFFLLLSSKSREKERENEVEQLQLQMEMLESQNELAAIDREYAQLEGNQVNILQNDSIVEKYTAAKAQIEQLMLELKNEKNKSAEQIARLKAEIETLKGILRDYAQRIEELMTENESLRDENTTVKNQNAGLRQQVSQNNRTIEQQAERLTLAEKLNVTGLNLRALNRKGKNEKNITKAVQLEVTFTIPQNNTTAPGPKEIYLRIVNPEGDLLPGNGGSFHFEGANLPATARKTIEYANEEIGGITIYWDVNSTLNPGDYRVELFCDGFRIASRNFTMAK